MKAKQPSKSDDESGLEHRQSPPAVRLPRSLLLGDPTGADFGKNLRELRQTRGLTLEALSFVTKGVDRDGKGVSRVSLSRYESGALPGLRELVILSHAFRVPLARLVYGDPEDPLAKPFTTLEFVVQDIVLDVLKGQKLIPREPDLIRSEEWKDLVEKAKKIK